MRLPNLHSIASATMYSGDGFSLDEIDCWLVGAHRFDRSPGSVFCCTKWFRDNASRWSQRQAALPHQLAIVWGF
ncbi:hypothetical protein F5X98DRAFT_332208 [Xylaria grammica]|nr:hypothetical protein F5X98DRAFT_332208 [Xylaria grammica]